MKKIVLIEDNQDIRETTQEILELADYQVDAATNGKEGVLLVKKERPDLVICDIMMPELDGYGVLQILGKNPETSAIPFIFLTAKADKSEMRKGMNLGADDYITKPFEETELLEAIETRLKRSENLKKDHKADFNELNEFINEARGLEELKDLSKDRKIRAYKKKDVIYREDDYANYLYFIIKGKVKSVKTDNYDKDLVSAMSGKGDFLGHIALIDGEEYLETATALEPTELAVIPRQDFLALLQKNKNVSAQFMKMLSASIKEGEKRLLQMAYAPVRERVAVALLNLIAKEAATSQKPSRLLISREDLASIVGTAKESLIRTLSILKKEGLVCTDGQEIEILDENGLKKAASGM